ncbi:TetR family transcriptional regulator [Cohnella lubricantis]|uniref:TetR/AcrR family transcriptional regulator n=1 Tax=Cohnella lubricantis TaxID=2163172 RepID=A0A841T822_9BACL|nr:TetR family transcriptional regulator [Cohnella lubricantis]MBB6677072.1 TetR/AcrR family transcriptional regulator [Cohnella lubricantis]MBP2118919.1 AcrR family transcriptional regulator [Cohnella lubricantis]
MESAEIDVKKRLLLAAKKLFARYGYDGTSIRQICEEAGANVALVSYHFGGKENIFKALFDFSLPLRVVDDLFAEPLDPVEGVKLMIREVIHYQHRDPELVRIIQHEMTHSVPRTEVIREYLSPIWELARSLLEEGRKQGAFRFRSLDTTFLYIWGGLLFPRDFALFEPVLTEPAPTMEQKIEDLTGFVLGALACEAERGVTGMW